MKQFIPRCGTKCRPSYLNRRLRRKLDANPLAWSGPGGGLTAIWLLLLGACFSTASLHSFAQGPEQPIYVGIGDSLSAAVQSFDANEFTQPNSHVRLIADKLSVPMPLPLIRTTPTSIVRQMPGRRRIDPSVVTLNIAVPGTNLRKFITEQADAYWPYQIDSEPELILYPMQGSQLEVAEMLRPMLATCWLGGGDVVGPCIAWNSMDDKFLNSVESFQTDFATIVRRLHQAGIFTVYANIPDTTQVAYLMDSDDLIRFTGSSHGLPPGHYTSMPTVILIRMGFQDASLLSDPLYVLDPGEVERVRDRIRVVNEIIARETAAVGMPMVDLYALFNQLHENPLEVRGLPITTEFTGGIHCLDGIHLSNFGQALVAQAFIQKINETLGTTFPELSDQELSSIILSDPFIDKDGDGRVQGRPGAGIFETVLFLAGVSGDRHDGPIVPPYLRPRHRLPPWDGELYKRLWTPSRGLLGEITEADRLFTTRLFESAMGGEFLQQRPARQRATKDREREKVVK